MGKEALVDWQSLLIAVICGVLVFGFKKFSSVWVIVIGILLGYVLYLL
jgi:chromate transporter